MNANTKGNENESLVRIKEILFGEELSVLDKKLEEIKTDFTTAIEESGNLHIQRIQELKSQHELQLMEIQQVIAGQAKQMGILKEVFENKLQLQKEEANKDIRQGLSELKQEMETLDKQTKADYESLKASINDQLEALHQKGLSKKEMAGMLEYFAAKLNENPA